MRTSTFAVMALAVLFAGCMGGSADGDTGTLDLMVSDQPSAIDDFDSLNVSFSEARIFQGDGSEDGNESVDGNESDDGNESVDGNESEGGYETVDIEGETVDLTTVVGDRATSIANVSLEPGTYQKIELHVEDTDGVVDGGSVDVKVPSEKLMITKPFTVEANETTEFVFDITVVEKGGGQGYNLLPVVSESGVAGEDVDVERGGAPADRGGPPAEAGA